MNDMDRKTNAVPSLSSAAISALQNGDKIGAIKIVRVETNAGLKEAKDAVEDYVRSHPALQSAFAAAQAGTRSAALRWFRVLVFIGIVFLAYYLVTKR